MQGLWVDFYINRRGFFRLKYVSLVHNDCQACPETLHTLRILHFARWEVCRVSNLHGVFILERHSAAIAFFYSENSFFDKNAIARKVSLLSFLAFSYFNFFHFPLFFWDEIWKYWIEFKLVRCFTSVANHFGSRWSWYWSNVALYLSYDFEPAILGLTNDPYHLHGTAFRQDITTDGLH